MSIPKVLAQALARTNRNSIARTLQAVITKDGNGKDWLVGYAGATFVPAPITITKNTKARLMRVAKKLKTSQSNLVRAAIHATLPIMERAARR